MKEKGTVSLHSISYSMKITPFCNFNRNLSSSQGDSSCMRASVILRGECFPLMLPIADTTQTSGSDMNIRSRYRFFFVLLSKKLKH